MKNLCMPIKTKTILNSFIYRTKVNALLCFEISWGFLLVAMGVFFGDGMKWVLDKHSTTELYPQPMVNFTWRSQLSNRSRDNKGWQEYLICESLNLD